MLEDSYTNLYKLLGTFNVCCEHAQADYFAINDTLVGAVEYGDIIPCAYEPGGNVAAAAAKEQVSSKNALDLGMLRAEYLKLTPAHLQEHGLRISTANPLCPRVCQDNTSKDGAFLQLHIFDYVTSDYDLAHFLAQRVMNWKKLLNTPLRGLAAKRMWNLAGYYKPKQNNQSSPESQSEPRANGNAACDQVTLLGERYRKYVPVDHVRTTQTLPFGPTSIKAPINTSFWIEQDVETERMRTRLIQADCLRITKEIDRICRKNNIGYFICSGTLLGALRNGSFIPWDDDIDIGMLRADYDKFIECAKTDLGSDFFLQVPSTDPQTPYLYGKLRLNNTEYVTSYTELRDSHKGISVDIFPFDLAPAASPEFAEFKREADKLAKNYRTIVRRKAVNYKKKTEQLRPMERVGRFVMNAWRKKYANTSLEEARKLYEDHVGQYNNGLAAFNGIQPPAGCDYAVSYVIIFTDTPLADLLPLQEVEFEGMKVYAPHNLNTIPTVLFGDYSQESPKHLQHAHHILKWKTSSR